MSENAKSEHAQKKPNKTLVNFAIDLVTLVLMLGLVYTGVPPGQWLLRRAPDPG